MPKEVVKYPATEGFSGAELSVHWSKEDIGGYVQVAATRHVWGRVDADIQASVIHADHSSCHECALAVEQNNARKADSEATGAPQMMTADFTDAPPIGEFDGPATVFTEPMTRREVNKLIRVLRRARDQAYGEDA